MVCWSLRSPDLTPCDFFSWGHLKLKIYSTPVNSTKELKRRIVAEVRGIIEEPLKKVWDNTKLRLNFIMKVEEDILKTC